MSELWPVVRLPQISRPAEPVGGPGPRRDVQAPYLAWPSDGPLESPFGPRWGRQHLGIDIDGETEDPVRAADAGRVILAEDEGNGYGLVVTLAHRGVRRGVRTTYAHLSGTTVEVGQWVGVGQQIGAIGTSGSVTGSHLHFEVHDRTGPVDPFEYLLPTD